MIKRFGVQAMLAGFLCQPAMAATTTTVAPGTITGMFTPYSADQVLVSTTSSPIIPALCGTGSNNFNFSTDANNANNHLLQALLISAMMGGKKVSLVLSGCSGPDPIIIAVTVVP